MERPEENIISKFITGECSEEELAQIRAWIAESDENAHELFRMESMYRELKASAMPQNKIRKAGERIAAVIEQEDRRKARVISISRYRRYAAVAVVCIVVAVAALLLRNSNNDVARKMLVAQAPAGSEISVSLSDGTRVWLHDGARLSYPKVFDGDLRKVAIEGEGYFEVAKNKAKPFVVESNVMSVRVLGTKFNFHTDEVNRNAEVSLIEGSVEVEGHHSEGMVMLSPGQKAEIDHSTGKLKVSQVNASLEALWHDDMIPFNNAGILEIAQTLEKVYGMKVVLADGVDLSSTYSGVIKRKESIDSVLGLLRNTIPMNYAIKGNTIIITSQR